MSKLSLPEECTISAVGRAYVHIDTPISADTIELSPGPNAYLVQYIGVNNPEKKTELCVSILIAGSQPWLDDWLQSHPDHRLLGRLSDVADLAIDKLV